MLILAWNYLPHIHAEKPVSLERHAFNICCPRDCVSRHNGGTSGAPLKPLIVDSALAASEQFALMDGLLG